MGTGPLRTASSTSVCLTMVVSCWVARDRVAHRGCCVIVWVEFQFVRVSSPWYRGHVLKWSQVSSSAWQRMHLVYLAGTWIRQRAYHRWYRVRRGSCSRASWRRVFVGLLGGYLGVGLRSRGGCGQSLWWIVGVRCPPGGPVWWPVVGWVWGIGTASLDLCMACPRVSIGGAVVAEGIGGRCCRWLWCGLSSRTCSSSGVWWVLWCLACVSARPLLYV